MATRNWLGLSAVALLAGGCQVLAFQWVTPATAAVGSLFAIECTVTTDGNIGSVGAVLQVPNGFAVLGASAYTTAPAALEVATIVRDEPSLLAAYTPDPGHFLASFSGQVLLAKVPSITARVKVYLRASSVAGPYQLELALATTGTAVGWTPQLGLGSFQTPGGSLVRPIQITATPQAPPFGLRDGVWDVLPGSILDVEAGDVDGDGRDDLVELGNGFFRVRRSTLGGFALPGFSVAVPGNVRALALADFDGDGFTDVALSNGSVAFGNGGSNWSIVAAVAHGMSMPAVAAGDVDGDGLPDLAFGDQQGAVVVRSQPNRTFLPWSQGLPAVAAGAAVASVQLVDLDHDGRAELVATLPRVFRSTPQGVWSVVGSLPANAEVVAIDVDGNGSKELLSSQVGQLFTYSPQGLVASPFQAFGFSRAVALDHDRDGRTDLFLAPVVPWSVFQLWHNTDAGAFTAVPLTVTAGFGTMATGVTGLAMADFDDDTFPDLAAVSDRLLAWRNTATGAGAYGEPCSAPGLAPDLALVGTLASGQTASLRLSGAAAQSCTLMWMGNSRTFWLGQPVLPLDLGAFGAPGCTLLAEPIELVGVAADAAGVATLPFTVPVLPATLEVSVFAQGAVVDLAANPFGGVFTRGLALKVQ